MVLSIFQAGFLKKDTAHNRIRFDPIAKVAGCEVPAIPAFRSSADEYEESSHR
jgi:hypothetical protein